MGSDKEESRQGLAGQLDTLPFRGPYVCSLLFFLTGKIETWQWHGIKTKYQQWAHSVSFRVSMAGSKAPVLSNT